MSLFKTNYKNDDEIDVSTEKEMVITGGEALTSANTGNEYASFTAVIRKDVEQSGAGLRVRYINFFFTEKSLWRAQKFAEVLGLPENREIESVQHFVDLCIGKLFKASLYYDEGYLKLKNFYPAEAPLAETYSQKKKTPKLEPVNDDDDMPF